MSRGPAAREPARRRRASLAGAGSRPRATETRERIVQAAAAVFAEHGYARTRVQDIARRAGVTTGALYTHFDDKADLLMHVVTTLGAEELRSFLRNHGPGASAADLLKDLGADLLRPHAARPFVLEAFAEARRSPEVAGRLRGQLDESFVNLRALIERARREGAVAEDVDTDALFTFSIALGLGFLLVDALDMPRPKRDAWARLTRRIVGSVAESDR